MTDLSDLIARVEAGKGADLSLDKDVWESLGLAPIIGSGPYDCKYIGGLYHRYNGSTWGESQSVPYFTTSLDAVLTLMPPECFWQLGHDGDGPDPSKFKARVFDPMKMRGPCISVTDDPVRALLAAILRAKEAGE